MLRSIMTNPFKKSVGKISELSMKSRACIQRTSAKWRTWPNFKPRRAEYDFVYYGINNTNPHRSKEHIAVRKNLKIGVNGANIEQDTAI